MSNMPPKPKLVQAQESGVTAIPTGIIAIVTAICVPWLVTHLGMSNEVATNFTVGALGIVMWGVHAFNDYRKNVAK